jgi:hypothetical protein
MQASAAQTTISNAPREWVSARPRLMNEDWLSALVGAALHPELVVVAPGADWGGIDIAVVAT